MKVRATTLVLLAFALPAHADEDSSVESSHMKFVERNGELDVTVKLNKLFDSKAYEALDSGIPSTVEIRMWVYPQGGSEPIAYQALERECVYDLWDEVYVIQLAGPDGRSVVKVKKHSEALQVLTEITDVRIADLSSIPYENVYQLAIEAELNPVSKETQAEVRRWLSQGTGGGGLDRGGSFFGSFVSVFVNSKIPVADRVVRLRSQTFFRPSPK